MTLSPAPSYPRAKRDRRDGIRQGELGGRHARRGRCGREDVFRRHRAYAPRWRREDRLHVDETKAERGRGDEEIRGAGNTTLRQVRRAAGPRPRDAPRIVNRDRDVSRAPAAKTGVPQKIEQRALPVFPGVEAGRRRGIGRDRRGHAREAFRHRGEVRLHVSFHARGSRVVSGAEPPELGRETCSQHDSGGRQTGGNQPPRAYLPFAREKARHS